MNYLYRMTHIDNIPHVLEHGITHRNSPDANPMYVSIGDSSIISKRSTRAVTTVDGFTFAPGDYIPFYFYARMPMLYNIQHGYNVKLVAPKDIVYLIVDLKKITEDQDREILFSDRHAISKWAKFYGREQLSQIDSILDLDAIRNNDWSTDYDIRERKQAEFLVKGDIPVDAICSICCYSDDVKNKLIQMGVQIPIIISMQAYY